MTCEFLVSRPRIRPILWMTSLSLVSCPQKRGFLWMTSSQSRLCPHNGGILWTSMCPGIRDSHEVRTLCFSILLKISILYITLVRTPEFICRSTNRRLLYIVVCQYHPKTICSQSSVECLQKHRQRFLCAHVRKAHKELARPNFYKWYSCRQLNI